MSELVRNVAPRTKRSHGKTKKQIWQEKRFAEEQAKNPCITSGVPVYWLVSCTCSAKPYAHQHHGRAE